MEGSRGSLLALTNRRNQKGKGAFSLPPSINDGLKNRKRALQADRREQLKREKPKGDETLMCGAQDTEKKFTYRPHRDFTGGFPSQGPLHTGIPFSRLGPVKELRR